MKRTIAFAFALLFASAASAEITGVWSASVSETRAGQVHLNITRGTHWDSGMTRELASLTGLTQSQLHSAAQVPVQFEIRSEAGNLTFGGTFRNGYGAGHFAFDGNPGYIETMRGIGLEHDFSKRRSEEESLMTFALHDVSTAFVKSMRALGYDESLKTYLSMRIHGVTEDFIEELGGLGYKNVSARDLTSMRIHGVTPEYIRELAAAGYRDVPVRKLISLRIHGVDVKTIEKLNALR